MEQNRAAWHTTLQSHSGGGWRFTVDGLLTRARKETEKNHTQSIQQRVPPFRSDSPFNMSCGKHSIMIFLNSFSPVTAAGPYWSLSQHALITKQRKMLKTGRLPIARLMQIDRRHLTPLTRFKLSIPLDQQVFQLESPHGPGIKPALCFCETRVLQHLQSHQVGKQCCLCHCLLSSLQQLLQKWKNKESTGWRSLTKPIVFPWNVSLKRGISIPSSWGNPENSLRNKSTYWLPTHRNSVKISTDMTLIDFSHFILSIKMDSLNSTYY